MYNYNGKPMPKEQMAHIYHKMYHKRNYLLRTFLINYLLIFFVWLIFMVPALQQLLIYLLKGTAEQANIYMMWLLGFWKIANVLLFLTPALGTWWEMRACRKQM